MTSAFPTTESNLRGSSANRITQSASCVQVSLRNRNACSSCETRLPLGRTVASRERCFGEPPLNVICHAQDRFHHSCAAHPDDANQHEEQGFHYPRGRTRKERQHAIPERQDADHSQCHRHESHHGSTVTRRFSAIGRHPAHAAPAIRAGVSLPHGIQCSDVTVLRLLARLRGAA